MTNGPIELRIDELVLHGFARDERIGEGVERELARLLAERGTSSAVTDAEQGYVNHREATISMQSDGHTVASLIAAAIHETMKGRVF